MVDSNLMSKIKDHAAFNNRIWDEGDVKNPKSKKEKNVDKINKKTANSGKAFKD